MSRLQPAATYLEPIVGWRSWRVLPVQTLSNGKRYRLCASGRLGIPKVWEPREAVVAVCSDFSSRHEAPHPAHECGIYAYAARDEAEAKLADLWRGNKARGTVWALGRVSLWGRVVECELGWRAQLAYPYDVAVFTDGKAADALAGEYAIDVERRRLVDLRALVTRHESEPTRKALPLNKAITGVWNKGWYDTSIYGVMDRYFLRPYHEDICRRLDAIAEQVGRLERSAPGSEGGRGDA